MKKHLLTFILITLTFIFNNSNISNAEISTVNTTDLTIAELESQMNKRFAEIEREAYIRNLIQYIEFESEIIVPNHIETKYVEYIYVTANQLKIPSRTAFRLVKQESNFRDTVISPMGAKGLMQLMPETRSTYYKQLRLDTLNLDSNQEDIYIGLNMLNDLQMYWRGKGNSISYSWKLSLASYNAGKGNVQKYKGVPPFKETQNFVAFILKSHSNPEFFANYKKKYENQIKVNS
jgi:soluble lytic murein transglycosylase-like protein